MQERWLSVEESAAHLGANRDIIYKRIILNKLPAHKLGRLWQFLAFEVDRWVKGGHAADDLATATPGAMTKRRCPQP
jgi:excisionase family DNA binding protein